MTDKEIKEELEEIKACISINGFKESSISNLETEITNLKDEVVQIKEFLGKIYQAQKEALESHGAS